MTYFSQQPIVSVSELTTALKNLLESEFRFIRVSGEISNLKNHFSGHSYFTLKDSGAQLRAVLFKQQKRFVSAQLQDGQQVVCFGRISVYEPRGDYQLIVDSVDAMGTGLLQQQFEALKQKLEQKGYFSSQRKRPLPPFPEKIVIISSPTGAAIHDFLKIYKLRRSSTHLDRKSVV
jgi:exodeoxyribonuclease VII large subunit